jgi:non-ribosomal peptide synthetase component F
VFFNVLNFSGHNVPGLAVTSSAAAGEPSEPVPSHSIFDLTLYVYDQGEGLVLDAVYRSDLFEATTISRMLRHLVRIFETALADPGCRVSRFPLTNGVEHPTRQPATPGGRFTPFDAEDTEQSIGARFDQIARRLQHAAVVTEHSR